MACSTSSTFTTRRVVLLGLVSSALITQLAGCMNSIPDVIKIGVAQPLTGNLAPQGKDLLNGVKLAV